MTLKGAGWVQAMMLRRTIGVKRGLGTTLSRHYKRTIEKTYSFALH